MNLSLSRNLKDRLKFIFPSAVAIGVFSLAIFLYFLPNTKEIVTEQKESFIQETVSLPIQICEYYAGLVRNGTMEDVFARKRALEIIKGLRYGTEKKDYFWILNTEPVLLMHPYRSDLAGTDVSGYRDETGTAVFLEMVAAAEADGSGFVSYRWQVRDEPEDVGRKLSYVSYFEPWDWIIGTGIYREDIGREIGSMTRSLFWVSVCTLLFVGILLLFIIRQGITTQQGRSEAVAELDESRNRYKQLIDLMHEGIMVVDTQKNITFVNDQFCSMLGRTKGELIGSSIENHLKEDSIEKVYEEMKKLSARDETSYTAEWQTKDGKRLAAIVSPRGLFDPGGNFLGSFAVITDITGQKLTEEKLTALLKEKTVLLKEIHHRVKNNLQLISSLFSLEYQKAAADESTKNVLYDSKLRIQTISRVHEFLYQTENLQDIAMRKYMERLIVEMRSAMADMPFSTADKNGSRGFGPADIRFVLEADDIDLSVEQAIPCGLIINELVSNSVKHAFPQEQKEKAVTLFLHKDNETIRFGVKDNGRGLPADFLQDDSKSLGVQLISTLTAQLKGEIIIDSVREGKGSRVEIQVPLCGAAA